MFNENSELYLASEIAEKGYTMLRYPRTNSTQTWYQAVLSDVHLGCNSSLVKRVTGYSPHSLPFHVYKTYVFPISNRTAACSSLGMQLWSTNCLNSSSPICVRPSGVTDSLAKSYRYRIILCSTCVERIVQSRDWRGTNAYKHQIHIIQMHRTILSCHVWSFICSMKLCNLDVNAMCKLFKNSTDVATIFTLSIL
jgi:hypothetical protein